MGMFDGLYIARSLIEKAVEGTDVDLKSIQSKEEYLDFQTKDLDNTLTSFYIEEDGSFCYEHQEYEWIKPDSNETNDWPYSLPYQNPVGEPVKVSDKRTAYIDFYDLYYTSTERIWVDFTAHIKDGMLAEPIKVKNIQKTNLEEEAIQTKKHRAEWNQIQSTWQWKLVCVLRTVRNKIHKLLYPLHRKLDNIETYLSKQAKQGTSFDENLRDQ